MGIREIRGLPGYAKYYRVFWKTRSRCRRAAGQHRSEVTSSGSSIPPFGRSHGRFLNEELYRDRSTTHRVVSGANSGVVYLVRIQPAVGSRVGSKAAPTGRQDIDVGTRRRVRRSGLGFSAWTSPLQQTRWIYYGTAAEWQLDVRFPRILSGLGRPGPWPVVPPKALPW